MPLSEREWDTGMTLPAATDRLERAYGEDAVKVYEHLFENPEKAFSAHDLFHEVFNPGPFLAGISTTNDEGESVQKVRDRSDEFDEAEERLSSLLNAMEEARFIETRVIKTNGGTTQYYRLNRLG